MKVKPLSSNEIENKEYVKIGESVYEVTEEEHRTVYRRWDDGMWVTIKFNNLISDEEVTFKTDNLKLLLNSVENKQSIY